jgi:hypothetical protein
MAKWIRQILAPGASTGNNTHASQETSPAIDQEQIALNFIIEAVGATPTVSYKYQYTDDDPGILDANAAWKDLDYILQGDEAETVVSGATLRTVTALGTDTIIPFLGTKSRQIMRRIRLVTSANTNVTYRAELQGIDSTP